MRIVSWPSSALASWIAARSVQVPALVRHSWSPIRASTASLELLTSKLVPALARPAASARVAATAAEASLR
jgi:hypothetical protein